MVYNYLIRNRITNFIDGVLCGILYVVMVILILFVAPLVISGICFLILAGIVVIFPLGLLSLVFFSIGNSVEYIFKGDQ